MLPKLKVNGFVFLLTNAHAFSWVHSIDYGLLIFWSYIVSWRYSIVHPWELIDTTCIGHVASSSNTDYLFVLHLKLPGSAKDTYKADNDQLVTIFLMNKDDRKLICVRSMFS